MAKIYTCRFIIITVLQPVITMYTVHQLKIQHLLAHFPTALAGKIQKCNFVSINQPFEYAVFTSVV